MYNEESSPDLSASNKILVAVISGVVIMVVIAFIVIVCARLDNGGTIVKADPSKCELIDARAVKTIPREWLEVNCPNLIESEAGEKSETQAQSQ
jgi:hypothetical protein